MKTWLKLSLIFMVGGVWLSGCTPRTLPQAAITSTPTPTIKEATLQLTSPVFKPLDYIPPQFTCDGENMSPPLVIGQVPAKSQSLALIVDDPDAPGGNWTHWLFWNLDPQVTALTAGEVPPGVTEGLNDFGKQAYGGPCPPSGIHRYQFTLYALDTKLDLSNLTTKPKLLKTLEGHIIAQTQLVGLYQRH